MVSLYDNIQTLRLSRFYEIDIGIYYSMDESYPKPVFISVGKAMMKSDTPIPVETALSDNKVDVDIEPETKGNKVNVQLCSLSLIFNCCARGKHTDPT
jgi:hypothetical protein